MLQSELNVNSDSHIAVFVFHNRRNIPKDPFETARLAQRLANKGNQFGVPTVIVFCIANCASPLTAEFGVAHNNSIHPLKAQGVCVAVSPRTDNCETFQTVTGQSSDDWLASTEEEESPVTYIESFPPNTVANQGGCSRLLCLTES